MTTRNTRDDKRKRRVFLLNFFGDEMFGLVDCPFKNRRILGRPEIVEHSTRY